MTSEEFLKLAQNAGLTAEWYMTNPKKLAGFVKLDIGRKFQCSMTLEQLWAVVEMVRNGVTAEVFTAIINAANNSAKA